MTLYHCTTKASLAGIVSSGSINESVGPKDCRHGQRVYTYVKFRMQAERFEGHTALGYATKIGRVDNRLQLCSIFLHVK